MFFQNTALLWGMLTVAVPIALHFWHQQRAKPMPWAMLRWLETPNQPPKRGFRFDNWLLLLLRCLLLIALSLLLARPVLNQKERATVARNTHLVEPSAAVVQANRFELERALAKQERLFWATTPLTPITALTDVPTGPPPNPLTWQTAVNDLPDREATLHTYLTNAPAWATAPRLHVLRRFVLHTTNAPSRQTPTRYVALPAGNRLTTGPDRRLTRTTTGAATDGAVATAPLRVLLQFRRTDERATVQAALNALTSVYGLTFTIDNQPITGQNYAWVLTDGPVAAPQRGTLYTVTGQTGAGDVPNVTYLPDVLTPTTSELVVSGQLPETLAVQLADHLGLTDGPAPLSRAQLAALFIADLPTAEAAIGPARPQNRLQTGLLVLFLGLLLAERWLAGRRGV